MGNFRRLIVISLGLLIVIAAVGYQSAMMPPVVAQSPRSCSDIVKAALQLTTRMCTRAGRNKACYGNRSSTAEPQPGISNFKFSAPGDIVDVRSIQVLSLDGLNVASETWGVALMRIQADLPDTSPEDNVTLVLFGNVQIRDASVATPAAATQAGPTLTPTATNGTPAPAPKTFKPMQAFYFKSGEEQSCKEAPANGLLIQTPKGKGTIQFSIDGATVTMGSSAFIQAVPGDEMEISMLDGMGTVTAFGRTSVATAGMKIGIPLDANLQPSGPPAAPEAFDPALMQPLPVSLLPQSVGVPPPATPAPAITLLAGRWLTTGDRNAVASGSVCPSALALPFVGNAATPTTLSVDAAGESITASGNGRTQNFSQVSTNLYSYNQTAGTAAVRSTIKVDLQVTSPLTISGKVQLSISAGGGCLMSGTFKMRYAG